MASAPLLDPVKLQEKAIVHDVQSIADSLPAKIDNDDGFIEAGGTLTQIKTVLKRIDAHADPGIKLAHAAHKEAVAGKKRLQSPLLDAERKLKTGMGVYQSEKRRIAEEEHRKQLEAARKADEERRLAEAEQLEAQGRKEEATHVLDTPAPLPVATMPAPTPKVEGVSFKKKYVFEIVNAALLPREHLLPNEKTIRVTVNSHGKHAEQMIPGIVVREESTVSARSA